MEKELWETIGSFRTEIKILYRFEGKWLEAALTGGEKGLRGKEEACGKQIEITLDWEQTPLGKKYDLRFQASAPAQVRMELSLAGEEELFHLIPANIFGDNNLEKAQTGEYPMLTYEHPEDVFCSPCWEFRADRATQPVSMLCCKRGALGVSIQPYTETEEGFIRNGVRAELPNKIAVSIGYTNDPVTYINKREYGPQTLHKCCQGRAVGRIYGVTCGETKGCPENKMAGLKTGGRLAAHKIIEEEYAYTRECPVYRKSPKEAARALLHQFVTRNWSEQFQNYTNMECHLPQEKELKAWRQLAEIGWTGGGIIAYPFRLAEEMLTLPEDYFAGRKDAEKIFDEMTAGYCEASGFLNDVTRPDWNPDWEPSPVNGWWTGLRLAYDCHCAYTNGSAVFYLLKTVCCCKSWKKEWRDTALKVLDTVISLQRGDGSYGYTYACDRKAVLDWEGFAGCWFAAAMPYAYQVTGEEKYLESAEKALAFYGQYVESLNCYGTPMDTWKSVDEEGNLAFIRGARLMHEATGEQKYLDYLELGARYQYLWQYGFRAKPEYSPLCGSEWNSCGSSVTSVSNPHAHPMGALVVEDIFYLAEKTENDYHKNRTEDLFAWLLHTMELYPETTGYGAYGVLTERYCPSDGLTIERYGNGEPASLWFTYNGWAAANVLEAVLERMKGKV